MKRVFMFLLVLFQIGYLVSQDRIVRVNNKFVETFEKSISIAAGGTLVISTATGDINLETWNNDKVSIKIEKEIEAVDLETAENLLKEFILKTESDDHYVRIEGAFYLNEYIEDFDVFYTILLPLEFSVDIHTEEGNIRVPDITGNVRVETQGGRIETGIINGGVRIKSTGGTIRTNDINGDAEIISAGGKIFIGNVDGILKAETAGGDVFAGEVRENVTIKTAGGDIEVAGSGGKIYAYTVGGNIEIGASQGPVELVTMGGNISVDSAGGAADVRTMGGNITLKSIEGDIQADTYGGNIIAEITLKNNFLQRNCELRSRGGDITLSLPSDINTLIDAQVQISRDSWGEYDIYSDFPLTFSREDMLDRETGKSRNRRIIKASGVINNGGNTIRIRSSDGDIYIKK